MLQVALGGGVEQLVWWWNVDLVMENSIGHVVLFALGLFSTVAMARLARTLFRGRLRRWAAASKTSLDDVLLGNLERPFEMLITAVGLRASFEALLLPSGIHDLVINVLTVVIMVFVTWGLTRSLDALRVVFVDPWVRDSDTKLDDQLVPIFDKTLKAFLWSMAVLIAFSNLGYDILSLLTGLGIGGLAVAMAAQATLSNVLGSVTIFADQPFQVDDLITIGDHTGVITQVGLHACRMRTFEGYTVTIPNSRVVDQPLVNRTVGELWRHDATVRLVYHTSASEVERAMNVLREILVEHPQVEDNIVRFTCFGESALELTFSFFVVAATPAVYLDTISEVNLVVLRRFGEEGFALAFPSVSVYMDQRSRG